MAATDSGPGPGAEPQAKYSCPICDKSFSKKSNIVRHVKNVHRDGGLKLALQRASVSCEQCKATFCHRERLLQHGMAQHGFRAHTVKMEFATVNGEFVKKLIHKHLQWLLAKCRKTLIDNLFLKTIEHEYMLVYFRQAMDEI